MAKLKGKKKVEPEPVELQAKRTKWSRVKESKAGKFVKGNEKTLWRSFLTALLTALGLLITYGPGWIDKYMENQKKQSERQAGWQIERRAQFEVLAKNDTTIINLLTKQSKTKKR